MMSSVKPNEHTSSQQFLNLIAPLTLCKTIFTLLDNAQPSISTVYATYLFLSEDHTNPDETWGFFIDFDDKDNEIDRRAKFRAIRDLKTSHNLVVFSLIN